MRPWCRRRQILIVGPSSVLGNWQRELQTWGAFRVSVYHGDGRELALQGVLQGRTEVLITSTNTYRWGPCSSMLPVRGPFCFVHAAWLPCRKLFAGCGQGWVDFWVRSGHSDTLDRP